MYDYSGYGFHTFSVIKTYKNLITRGTEVKFGSVSRIPEAKIWKKHMAPDTQQW